MGGIGIGVDKKGIISVLPELLYNSQVQQPTETADIPFRRVVPQELIPVSIEKRYIPFELHSKPRVHLLCNPIIGAEVDYEVNLGMLCKLAPEGSLVLYRM